MEIKEKMVDFYKYCPTCEYNTIHEGKDPCNECMDEPVNVGTDKPVKYVPRENF